MAHRRSVLLAFGALATGLVVLGAVALAVGRDDDSPAPRCRLINPFSVGTPAAGSSGIHIVEQGYTIVPSSATTVSMGSIVANTTDQVAYRTRVMFDVLDDEGRSVVHDWHRSRLVQEVPVILPGTRVAVGAAVALTEAAQADRDSVARISIVPAVTRWLPPGDGNNGLAPVTGKPVPGGSRRDHDGSGFIRYTTESANCAPLLSRGTSLVFRDAGGTIVGGNIDANWAWHACEPGTATYVQSADAGLRAVPASADLDRTEVTVYCDFARPAPTQRPGEPVNY